MGWTNRRPVSAPGGTSAAGLVYGNSGSCLRCVFRRQCGVELDSVGLHTPLTAAGRQMSFTTRFGSQLKILLNNSYISTLFCRHKLCRTTGLLQTIAVITHAVSSRVNIAIMCLCVCPHDKTKTTETRITKLGTRITIPHLPMNIRSKINGCISIESSAPLV